MKSIIALALVVVLALSVQHALAEECTPEICTESVLVEQNFDSSVDCTGNFTLSTQRNYTDKCDNYNNGDGSYNSSASYTCSRSGGFVITFKVGLNCPAQAAAALTSVQAIGLCVPTGESSSRVTWCNAAMVGTPTPTKPVDTTAAVLPATLPVCNTTTGCSDGAPGDYGTLYQYSDASCTTLVGAVPPTVFVGLDSVKPELGTCYITNRTDNTRDNRLNVVATCSNGQYKYATYQNGCGSGANLFISTSIQAGKCVHYDTDQWMIVKCPGSSASTLVTAPLMMVIFLIAFLLI